MRGCVGALQSARLRSIRSLFFFFYSRRVTSVHRLTGYRSYHFPAAAAFSCTVFPARSDRDPSAPELQACVYGNFDPPPKKTKKKHKTHHFLGPFSSLFQLSTTPHLPAVEQGVLSGRADRELIGACHPQLRLCCGCAVAVLWLCCG